jgi:hypothetical protein
MPQRVDRPTIQGEVFTKLNHFVEPKPPLATDADEKRKLLDDLGMTGPARRAMALPYTKISQRHGGQGVSQPDAQKCVTVKDAVDLVLKQANA